MLESCLWLWPVGLALPFPCRPLPCGSNMAIGQVAGLAGNKCNWSKNDNWYLKLCDVHAGTFAAEKLKRSSKKNWQLYKKIVVDKSGRSEFCTR